MSEQSQHQLYAALFLSVSSSYLTLQVISLFGPFDLHVIREHGVLVQPGPVVLITGQGLGVFSCHQVNHVGSQVVLATGCQGILAVLLVACQPTRVETLEKTWVVQDAFDPDVFTFFQQVAVFVIVLQAKVKENCQYSSINCEPVIKIIAI